MQNIIFLFCIAALPVKWFASGFKYSNYHVDDIALLSFFVIGLVYFIAKNARSAVGISVLIASAVTAYGVYFGFQPKNSWLEATMFLLVWILVPQILPGIIRFIPWVVSLASSKKTTV
ncbi:TPA: hypothetical protein ACNV18_000876 [Pseudomonas putida]|nr:hypothetical protein [Pseudomonas aeruginosa]